MAKAARDLLAIPGSEVDCERLFCGGKDLLGVRRAIIGGDTMLDEILVTCFDGHVVAYSGRNCQELLM
jgi:hypothetical protein